jgi:hypothetical protein
VHGFTATGLFFSCENWYPLYSVVAHDALCSHASYGFRWLAISQMSVVFFAMILLTARAGLYEMPDPEVQIVNESVVEPNEEKAVTKAADSFTLEASGKETTPDNAIASADLTEE